MNRFCHIDTLLLLVLLVAVVSGTASAGCIVPDAVYRGTSAHVLAGDYTAAEAAADSLIAAYPDEPAGCLFKAAVIQYASTDYEDTSRESEFLDLTGKASRLARDRMRGDPADLWAEYYLGAAEGMAGAWRTSAGDTVSGIMQGRAGGRRMAGIVAQDSTFYDACLLLGSYRFWSAAALKPLSWLPLVGGDAGEGLELARCAIDRGRLSGPLAETVYIEMLLAHDPAAAAESAERMADRYPDCRLFAWQLGEAYKKLERWDDALRVFSGLAERFAADPADDGSGQLRAWWKLAVLAKTIGETDDCVYFCQKVTAFGSDPVGGERQRRRIDEARTMLKELEDE